MMRMLRSFPSLRRRWALQWEGENPVALLETNNDITERKRAEESQRESEEDIDTSSRRQECLSGKRIFLRSKPPLMI